jgi:hypothetical protein
LQPVCNIANLKLYLIESNSKKEKGKMKKTYYETIRNQSDMSQLVYAFAWYKQHNMHNKAKQCLKAIEQILNKQNHQVAA